MKTGFFEEGPGVKSSARLISFMFSCFAIVASGFLFWKNSDYAAGIAVFSAIATFAVGLKLGQKPWEKSNEQAGTQPTDPNEPRPR